MKGPSSNIALTRQISQAMTYATNNSLPPVFLHDRRQSGIMNMSIPQPQTKTHLEATKETHSHGSSRVNIYALPSDAQSLELIEKYFSKTGQLLPFIHEQSFFETYMQMKKYNLSRVRRTWLGLLNIIFAIAMSLSNDSDIIPAQQRIEQSDVFYQRANALCDGESRRNTSLEMGVFRSQLIRTREWLTLS